LFVLQLLLVLLVLLGRLMLCVLPGGGAGLCCCCCCWTRLGTCQEAMQLQRFQVPMQHALAGSPGVA
jgi:hypothetical protein